MFFYGLFHLNCSDKDIYLTMFLDNLTLSKDRIENRAIGFNIMNLNEQTKMEISFYNILLIIIDSKESIELIKSNHSYLQIFFSKLFDSVVIIRKNNALLRKIEAKHLFPLLKNIEEIVLRNIYKNNFKYNYNVGNIFYLIIHQFSDEFLNEKLFEELAAFNLNDELIKILKKALEPNENARYQTPALFIADLNAYLRKQYWVFDIQENIKTVFYQQEDFIIHLTLDNSHFHSLLQ